jgi:HEPN domain-containing protein
MQGTRSSEARRWFQQARHDLRAARWNADGGFHDTACFLAQQGGEKALKALLYFCGGRRAALLTHSLVEMVRENSQQYASMIDRMADARTLDLHYIPSRYPNGLPSGYPHQFYSPDMSGQAILACERIVVAVSELLRQFGGQDVVTEES